MSLYAPLMLQYPQGLFPTVGLERMVSVPTLAESR
jgi:hypothetical protein